MFDLGRVREDFPATKEQVYLNAASISLAPMSAVEATRAVVGVLGEGPGRLGARAYRQRLSGAVEAARREAALLVGASLEEIALIDDTTMGLNLALASIPFSPGDNLVFCDLEYPQIAITAEHARRRFGVEIRVVRHRGGRADIGEFAALVDGRTRAVIVSSVQWVNGLRLDLAALSGLAEARDFFLIVDAIQQLGAVPLDVSVLRVDFLAAGGHKWLNSPFGVGFLYASRNVWERVEPGAPHGLYALAEPAHGWEQALSDPELTPFLGLPLAADARRFDVSGLPKVVGSAGLAAALAYLKGIDARGAADHILALGGWLIAELEKRGFRVWTPKDARLRAGIITFDPCRGPEVVRRVVEELANERVYVSARYCSGVGGLRVSVHYYNSRGDLEAFLAALDTALARLQRGEKR